MKIHKRMHSRWAKKAKPICNEAIQTERHHYHWKRVTCKNCLKQEKNPKLKVRTLVTTQPGDYKPYGVYVNRDIDSKIVDAVNKQTPLYGLLTRPPSSENDKSEEQESPSWIYKIRMWIARKIAPEYIYTEDEEEFDEEW